MATILNHFFLQQWTKHFSSKNCFSWAIFSGRLVCTALFVSFHSISTGYWLSIYWQQKPSAVITITLYNRCVHICDMKDHYCSGLVSSEILCLFGHWVTTRFTLHYISLPVMTGSLGFHLSSSISPSRETLSKNRGRREVEDRSLWINSSTDIGLCSARTQL